MNIAGFQKTSLIDFPGEISSIVFTQGCNFRCPYCHNPELVEPDGMIELMDNNKILEHLKRRRDLVPAVTITGGEPTVQHDLMGFISTLKMFGLKVKLDTNGTNPEVLRRILDQGLLDYVAMDIKAPVNAYEKVTNRSVVAENILESIDLIKSSSIKYEFRTTVLKSLLSRGDFHAIAEMVEGARCYVVQQFHKTKTLRLDGVVEQDLQYSDEELEELKNIVEPFVKKCFVRL